MDEKARSVEVNMEETRRESDGSEQTETSKTTKEDEDTDITEQTMTSSNSDADDLEKQTTSEASVSDRTPSRDSAEEEESKADPRGSEGGDGGGCRSCSTPLRLRRLPASFWKEPNVPKDPGKNPVASCKVCRGALRSCHLSPAPPNHLFYAKDRLTQFGSYGDRDFLAGSYRDPGSSPSGLAASQSRGGTFYPDLFYLDAATPSSPASGSALGGSGGFLPLPSSSIRLGPIVGGPTEPLPVAGGSPRTPCSGFFATAALYGHVMRRSLHNNSGGGYRHGNGGGYGGDVMAAAVTSSSGSLDDLWRLFPCRSLPEVFSGKRFHPYL